MPFELIRQDITRMHVDAIVNAANQTLLGGGGVDGAIHAAAGPELLEECRTLGGCPTGEARITGAYRLPCRWVIHTVGPVYRDGFHGEQLLLASCYRRSLELASQNGCETVAFPLISAGAYGYPREEALRIAVRTIRAFLEDHEMTVFLVVYDSASFAISRQLYENIRAFISDAQVMPARNEQRRRLEQDPDLVSRILRAPGASGPGPKGRRKRRDRESAEDSAPAGSAADASPPVFSSPAFPAAAVGAPSFPAPAAPAPEASGTPESLEEYLRRMDESFRDMLLRKIDERGITDAACYKKANVDRKLFNKIKNQAGYRPGKTTVLAFAVALELPLPEVDDMLRKAGFSLSHSNRLDLIVEYFLRRGCYEIDEINSALFSFDQNLLGSGW